MYFHLTVFAESEEAWKESITSLVNYNIDYTQVFCDDVLDSCCMNNKSVSRNAVQYYSSKWPKCFKNINVEMKNKSFHFYIRSMVKSVFLNPLTNKKQGKAMTHLLLLIALHQLRLSLFWMAVFYCLMYGNYSKLH